MDQEQNNQNKDASQKSGDDMIKAQHKNKGDWANQNRKSGDAMGDKKYDSQGNPIDPDANKTNLK